MSICYASCSSQITTLSLPPSPLSANLQMQASLNHEPQPLSLLTIYNFGWQFLQMTSYSKVEITSVELATKNQSHCARCFEERQCQLTASNFGNICNGAMTTSKVKWLIYTSNCFSIQSSSAIIWVRIHESTAFEMYESSIPQSMVLRKPGIYIYEDDGFLAVSPDGILLMADSEVPCGMIDIKCPYTARNMMVQEACSNSKPFYCKTV